MALQLWFRLLFSSLRAHGENVFKWQLEETSKPRSWCLLFGRNGMHNINPGTLCAMWSYTNSINSSIYSTASWNRIRKHLGYLGENLETILPHTECLLNRALSGSEPQSWWKANSHPSLLSFSQLGRSWEYELDVRWTENRLNNIFQKFIFIGKKSLKQSHLLWNEPVFFAVSFPQWVMAW